MNANHFARFWRRDYREDLMPSVCIVFVELAAAVDADRNLAAAAESSQRGTFRSDGKARVGVIEKRESFESRAVALARLNTQGALTGSRAKIRRVEALAHPIGFSKAIQACGGKQNRFHLAFGELAQARVDISSELYGDEIGPQSLQLRATALAAGADLCSAWQCSQIRVLDRDKDVAWIDARRGSSEDERFGELCWQIFERVNGKIDTSLGKRFFNFLGEHPLGADLSKSDFLQPVTGGFDDLDFGGVTLGAQKSGNMICLPERELRSATADAQIQRRTSALPLKTRILMTLLSSAASG